MSKGENKSEAEVNNSKRCSVAIADEVIEVTRLFFSIGTNTIKGVNSTLEKSVG